MGTTNDAYMELVTDLIGRMDDGDDFATRVIAAMALLIGGWRAGDPDPVDPTDGGETVIEFSEALLRRAA